MNKHQHTTRSDLPKNTSSAERENQQLSELIDRCKQQDSEAFNRLYQLCAARLNGIAYRITGNVDTANEVLQEAFLQIWQRADQFQSTKGQAFTWLAAILRYRAYDRLRRDKQQHHSETFEEQDAQHSMHHQQIEQQLAEFSQQEYPLQAINECLKQLEHKQSQAIAMAYLYGHSRIDIAQYYLCPVNTVKSWIRRGLQGLQLCLNQ